MDTPQISSVKLQRSEALKAELRNLIEEELGNTFIDLGSVKDLLSEIKSYKNPMTEEMFLNFQNLVGQKFLDKTLSALGDLEVQYSRSKLRNNYFEEIEGNPLNDVFKNQRSGFDRNGNLRYFDEAYGGVYVSNHPLVGNEMDPESDFQIPDLIGRREIEFILAEIIKMLEEKKSKKQSKISSMISKIL